MNKCEEQGEKGTQHTLRTRVSARAARNMPKWRAKKASRGVRDTAVSDRKSRRRGEKVSVVARMVRRAADNQDQIAREFELTVIVQYTVSLNHRHLLHPPRALLAVFAHLLPSFRTHTQLKHIKSS